MNDIASSGGASSSPAPSSAPSAPSTESSSPPTPSSVETLSTLSEPENVEEYAAQRSADDGKTERDASEPHRRANRYERLKRARDAAQAEAAALKAQAPAPPPSDTGDDAPMHEAGAGEQHYTPEERAEINRQLGQQAARAVESRAVFREREARFAAAVPNYREALQNVRDIEIPDHVGDLLRESPCAPEIIYHLANSVDGLETLMKVREMSPTQVAAFVAKSEAIIEMREQRRAQQPQQRQQPQPPRRVTNAPKPIVPLQGGAAPPSPDLRHLAESDDVSKYAAARERQQRAKLSTR